MGTESMVGLISLGLLLCSLSCSGSGRDVVQEGESMNFEGFITLRTEAIQEAIRSASEEQAADLRSLREMWAREGYPLEFWKKIVDTIAPRRILLSVEQGTPGEPSYVCRAVLEVDSGCLLVNTALLPNGQLGNLAIKSLDKPGCDRLKHVLMDKYHIGGTKPDSGSVVVDDPYIALVYWNLKATEGAVVIYDSQRIVDLQLSGAMWYIDSVFNY